MIIRPQTVEVSIRTMHADYYRSRGYDARYGVKLVVDVEDLMPQSNKKVECECDVCGERFYRQYQLVSTQETHRCYRCARVHVGKTMDMTRTIEATKRRVGSMHPRWTPNKSAFKAYSNRVRWLTQKVYAEFENEINPKGLPRTLCGVVGGFQVDHKISIRRGFEMGISPEELASLENLELVPWEVNRAKGFN